MPDVTVSSMSAIVKQQYERRLLSRALPRFVYGAWGMPARITRNGSLEWRRFNSLPAVTTPLVDMTPPGTYTNEMTPPSAQNAPTVTQITAYPKIFGAYLKFSELVELTSFDPLLSELSAILGEQAGLSADTVTRDTLVSGYTFLGANGKASRSAIATTDKISFNDILKAYAMLVANHARGVNGESFVLILHPYSYAQLVKDSNFAALFQHEAARDPNSPLRTAKVGRILDMDVYVTGNAPVFVDAGATGTDVYAAILIGGESYGIVGLTGMEMPDGTWTPGEPGGVGQPNTGKRLNPVEIIVKPVGSAGALDPLNQFGTIGWKMAFTTKVLNQAWIFGIEHATDWS